MGVIAAPVQRRSLTSYPDAYPKRASAPALPARAEELKADLLVMGGHGRSRMRERIFGDVTWQFLDHHAIAMLIAY